ncbi:MAG: type IV toxin-antitoxin system AbiEi family antitoxin [Microbacteriaceae bacterium]
MSRLPSVLTTSDLPLAELCAAQLDGQVFRIDECFEPVDIVYIRSQRAQAIGSLWSGKFIAERSSATWIWGATQRAPLRHELCVSLGARARPATGHGVSVREVVIENDEFVTLGGMRVTTPLRTLIDLARFAPEGDSSVIETMISLARIGSITRAQCAAALERRKNIPHKTIAWQRILRAGVRAD